LLDQALKWKRRKAFKKAVQVLAAIVKEYPDCATAFGLMGGIYYVELHQPKKAVSCFEQATKLSPRSEFASLGLFHSLWTLGRHDRAIAEMERFQTLAHSADYEEIAKELKQKEIL
jgi:tetratricopeptide (TPR) repeat protein